MSDANGPQALYSAGPELVKMRDFYDSPHVVTTALPQNQNWGGPPPPSQQQQQQHYHHHNPGTPAMTESYTVASLPPPSPPPAQNYDAPYEKSTRRGGRPNWLLAVAACLLGIIIGGAVVGGVLGSMLASRPPAPATANTSTNGPAAAAAECRTSDPARGTATATATTTPTPTGSPTASMPLRDYAAANWRNVSTLAFPCPRQDGATVAAMDGTRFRVECALDSIGAGRESPGDLRDLQSVVAYSFEDCVRACASFNRLSVKVQGRSPALVCRTVVWRRRMDEPQFLSEGGNCFLKNATRADGNGGLACPDCMAGTLL